MWKLGISFSENELKTSSHKYESEMLYDVLENLIKLIAESSPSENKRCCVIPNEELFPVFINATLSSG